MEDVNKRLEQKYLEKSIRDLAFILSNAPHYTKEQLAIARVIIEQKRSDWRKQNREVAKEIDTYIRTHTWFDFHVTSFDGYKLTVVGSIDLLYYHQLEIVFQDVFFLSGCLQGWHSDTEQMVFNIPEDEIELNQKYEIEQDYQLFIFKSEDRKNDILIAANSLSFDTTLVKYTISKN